MSSRTVRAITFCLLPMILPPPTAQSAANTITHVRSYIEATAHVESPLGLTEAAGIDATEGFSPDTAEYFFWLYRPNPEGVCVTIEGDGSAIVPTTLQDNDLASLIQLAGATGGGEVIVTVVTTDN